MRPVGSTGHDATDLASEPGLLYKMLCPVYVNSTVFDWTCRERCKNTEECYWMHAFIPAVCLENCIVERGEWLYLSCGHR